MYSYNIIYLNKYNSINHIEKAHTVVDKTGLQSQKQNLAPFPKLQQSHSHPFPPNPLKHTFTHTYGFVHLHVYIDFLPSSGIFRGNRKPDVNTMSSAPQRQDVDRLKLF